MHGAAERCYGKSPTNTHDEAYLARDATGPSNSMRPRDAAALLGHAPQTIPFAVRLSVFQKLIAADKHRGKWDVAPAHGGPRPIAFSVQRGRAVECGMRSLAGVGVRIKGPMAVTYVDTHGRQVLVVDDLGCCCPCAMVVQPQHLTINNT